MQISFLNSILSLTQNDKQSKMSIDADDAIIVKKRINVNQ